MPNFHYYINQKSDYYLKVRYSNYLKTIFKIDNYELIMPLSEIIFFDDKEIFTIYKRRTFFFDKEVDTFVCDKDEVHKKVKEKMFKICRCDKLNDLLI
jgi:hypothetical protein